MKKKNLRKMKKVNKKLKISLNQESRGLIQRNDLEAHEELEGMTLETRGIDLEEAGIVEMMTEGGIIKVLSTIESTEDIAAVDLLREIESIEEKIVDQGQMNEKEGMKDLNLEVQDQAEVARLIADD